MTRTHTTTTTKKKTNYHSFYVRVLVVLVVQVLAALVVLAGVGLDPAKAAFPGANGKKIVFSSNKVTRANPTGEPEIFTMNADGSKKKARTSNDAPDTEAPDWQPLVN